MMNRILVGLLPCATLTISDSLANELDVEPSARYRFQQIDDEARGDATANTLKLRLTAQWQANENWQSFAQADLVHAFREEEYNSVTVTRATSPIPESTGAELNQVWFKYVSDYDWSAVVGRQMLGFDNERHVSSVEFWQNDQTFDALTINYNDSTYWNISYAYLTKAHRIFGDDARLQLSQDDIRFDSGIERPFLELGNHDHNSHLLNVNYAPNRYVGITAYAYMLENDTANQLSSNTFGVRVDGEVKPSDIKYGYTAELANQSTIDDSPWDYSDYYVFVEMSAQYKSHQIAVSHERLSEDNGFAFTTSLGNNHKFLGWADVFNGYLNADGIRNTYITYRGRKAKLRWRLVAHHFESDTTGKTAGHEIDFELGYRFNRQWQATILSSMYFTKGGVDGLASSQNDLSSWTLSLSYQL